MAFFSHALTDRDLPLARSRVRAPARPGLFARFIAAMMESRQRQADRAIAEYLAHTGGRLTDSVEREIERRFLSGKSQQERGLL